MQDNNQSTISSFDEEKETNVIIPSDDVVATIDNTDDSNYVATLDAYMAPLDDYGEKREQANRDDLLSPLSELDEISNKQYSKDDTAPPELPGQPKVEEKKGFLDRTTKDVVSGFMSAPMHIVNGIVEGISGIDKTLTKIGMIPSQLLAQGLEATGLAPEGLAEANKKTDDAYLKTGRLSTLEKLTKSKDDSNTGALIKTASEYMVGLSAVSKMFKGQNVASRIGKFTAADLLVFDEQDKRLSNLIGELGPEANAITSYISANEEDGFLLGKAKQAVEGVFVGSLLEGMVSSFKLARNVYQARKAAQEVGGLPAVEGQVLNEKVATDFKQSASSIGDIESDKLILRKKKIKAAEKASTATAEDMADAMKRPQQAADEVKINFHAINAPEDVKKLINTLMNKPGLLKNVQEARRGRISDKELAALSGEIDAMSVVAERQRGQALNAEEGLAVKELFIETAMLLREQAAKAYSTQSAADLFNLQKLQGVFNMVAPEFMGARAEAGRAVRAMGLSRKDIMKAGNLDIDFITKTMEQFGSRKATIDLAKKLANSNLSVNQLSTLMQDPWYIRTIKGVEEMFQASLLASPATHTANMVGIMGNVMSAVPKRFMESLIPESGVAARESLELFYGMKSSFGQATKNAIQAYKTGKSALGEQRFQRQRHTSVEYLDAKGIFKPFAYAMDYYTNALDYFSFKAVTAVDEFGKTLFMNGEQRAMAFREGEKKGLSGAKLDQFIEKKTLKPPQRYQEAALDYAKYELFMSDLGEWGSSFHRAVNKIPGARLELPFIKTNVNIFKYAMVDHTPLALLTKNTRAAISAGGRDAAKAYAQIGFGSMMMSIGAEMSMSGTITGFGPRDPRERKALIASGWRPFSIKIGDTYVSYERIEPINTLFGLASSLSELLSNYSHYEFKEHEKVEEAATAASLVMGNFIVDKLFLRQFSDISTAVHDPKKLSQHIDKIMSGFAPNVLARATKFFDAEVKATHGLIDSIMAKLPGGSSSVLPRRNIFGEALENYYPKPGQTLVDLLGWNDKSMATIPAASADFLVHMFNPINFSKARTEPIDHFLLQHGAYIDPPGKKINYGWDGNFDCSEYPEIYDKYQELVGSVIHPVYGKTLKETLNELVSGESGFSVLVSPEIFDEESRKAAVQKVFHDYREIAALELRQDKKFSDIIDNFLTRGKEKKEARRLKDQLPNNPKAFPGEVNQ